MRRKFLLLVASLCCGVPPASAAPACPAVTRVGLSDLGYAAYREQGRIAGISVDIAREMARRSGCKFEFHWYPRQRLFIELAAGHIDMTMGSLRLPERDAYADHLPYAWVQYDLVLADPGTQHYTSLSDFVARGTGRLNVTRGLAYDPAIETQLARLAAAGRLEVVNDFETVFGKLEMGRADGTLATPPIYSKYLKQSRLQARAAIVPLPESAPRVTGIYLSRNTVPADTRQYYAAVVKAMLADQAVQGIFAHYFDDAAVKRAFKPGLAPLLNGLSTPDKPR
ncbi:polar amino acid transport system substrate-binding protein [Duganella sp. 1224]|uniref:substrate-binding periplasmic protein n=1 Tax=Duganella sp. 1224 TaxID=2587052 RepID=UPI0015CEE2D3|nr:transporter substrate-binding domain-containing protein [Duganella sp. 1224]NYE59895.1 polar amino acid transport system substrate-binding protein [Duganella sp. 1224]